ncbi:TonB-dependent receptor [Flavobacterium sp. ZS1P14]|uniref:TonB-dependent receptor n=1 Tax=Flavobacterium sp. ZS1P14 TaxID=3401729 RepID=UPI003AAD34DD
MKKPVVKQRLLIRIMKITLFQFVLALVFSSVTMANSMKGQEKLDTKVTITITNMTLETALSKLEESTHVKFSYNSRMAQLNQKVSIKANEESLSTVLARILKPLNIGYTEVSNLIVLQKESVLDENSTADQTKKNQFGAVVSEITIKGKITDKQGLPLPSATVLVKNSNKTTTADLDGNYTINASESDILIFSYIGFTSKEVPVSGQKMINVVLEEDIAKLDEVVVVGYGTQKRSKISGAVSEVSQKAIARNPSANLSNSLVGQATGIIATQRSGEPGKDDSNIYIRGIGTIGDSSPIYVIDGIVRSSSDFSQLSSSEIQSFSILKDAASAAVFGIRAGNGVILVTTKRGAEGKMQIDFNTSSGVQERTKNPEFLNSYEYATLYNEALANDGKPAQYSQDDLQKYLTHSSPDTHPDSDWFSVLKKTALMHNYNLSATGGTDKVRYATSFGYLKQEGIIPSNDFKRYNFRSNIDANVTNTTKLSFDVSGRDEKTNNVASEEVFRWMSGIPNNRTPIQWSNGEYSNGPSYLTLPENGYRKRNIQAFRGRMELEQQLPFIEGLSIKGIASYDKTLTDNKNWTFTKIPFFNRLSDGTFVQAANGPTSLIQNHLDEQSVTLETHLNYKKTIGKSDLTGLVLYTQTKQLWNFLGASREGYTLAIDELNFGAAANRNNNGYSGSSGRQGVVGRVNWSYDDKYVLEGSFRADGSEQFAKGNRWGFFPSFSAGYVISNESFLNNSSTIDYLKIRGSYGVLGNDRLRINNQDQRFLYLQSYNVNGSAVFGDANVQQAIVEGRLSNPNVTWETVKKLNIGFDATLWKGKLTATVDYFFDKRSDILADRNLSVPSLLGVGLPIENLAKVNNRGIEFTVGHKNNITEDLHYSMSANLTFAKNKIVFIDEAASVNPNIKRTGLSLNTQFGYHAIGLFQTQAEVDAAPTQLGNTGPGDIRYEDINSDGKINDLDRVAIGKSNTPEIIFGYNGNIQYKDFEFSFLFQGATNVNQYYAGEGAWPFFVGSNALRANLDRWTPTNTNASEPRVLVDPTNLNHAESSFWMKDASYLRLKNVELAYSLPIQALKLHFVQGVRIYINANNVATWSKIKNYDPENGNGRGWDYPQFRIWNAGINFKF